MARILTEIQYYVPWNHSCTIWAQWHGAIFCVKTLSSFGKQIQCKVQFVCSDVLIVCSLHDLFNQSYNSQRQPWECYSKHNIIIRSLWMTCCIRRSNSLSCITWYIYHCVEPWIVIFSTKQLFANDLRASHDIPGSTYCRSNWLWCLVNRDTWVGHLLDAVI